MRRRKTIHRFLVDGCARVLLVMIGVGFAAGADDPHQNGRADQDIRHEHRVQSAFAERSPLSAEALRDVAIDQTRRIRSRLIAWYVHTPPADRVTWAGMTASAVLGLCVLLERLARLRERKTIPPEFTARFLDRLYEGKLDCGQALDHCELNPSPAARVALAAVRRWGRPPADLERAVAMAHRVESERLRRNVGTLRRIAVLTPLLGLLGTLFAVGRALEVVPTVAPPGFNAAPGASAVANLTGPSIAWGPLLAAALTPLCAGIIIATVALVAYDGLLTRVENLAGSLDRLGAETIDAIALTAPISAPVITVAQVAAPARTPHQSSRARDDQTEATVRSSEHDPGF